MPDNGNIVASTPVTAWQLIGTTISVVAAFGLALWMIIKDVSDNYLTIREHSAFEVRVSSDLKRIGEEQSSHGRADEKRFSNFQTLREADLAFKGLSDQIILLREQLNRLSIREDERHLRPHSENGNKDNPR